MTQILTLRDTLDHDVRNSVVGIALELRTAARAIRRLEEHLNRIDKACTACLAQMEPEHSEFSNIEKKEVL